MKEPVSNSEFIVRFIADASARTDGKNALEVAKEEIAEIDSKIREAEKLKLRRMKLMLVVEHFGDDSLRRKRSSSSTPTTEDVQKDSDEILSIQEKIKSVVANRALTAGEIITEVGSYEKDFLIYRALKLLGDKEVILRDEQGRVKPGKNWSKQ